MTPTSNNVEQLFNQHAGVDAVEEPLDVAPPALQGAAGFCRGASQGAILQKHSAEPAEHLLDPLQQQRESTKMEDTSAQQNVPSCRIILFF